MTSTEIVFGVAGEDLVFIERHLADELALLRSDFGTWGDAKAALPEVRWAEIVGALDASGEEVPEPEAEWDPSAIPGFEDGDWPEWPAQVMLDWMPAEVAEQFGRRELSVHSGPYLAIDPENADAVVAALAGRGFSCARDDALVATASGY